MVLSELIRNQQKQDIYVGYYNLFMFLKKFDIMKESALERHKLAISKSGFFRW